MSEKKMTSDLEKMGKDRRKAEEAYLENQQRILEVQRIQRDGINTIEELLLYITNVIESVKHSEDLARQNDNNIVYSEAIGIRREMEKLLILIFGGGAKEETTDGTEEAHRTNNNGEEGYV